MRIRIYEYLYARTCIVITRTHTLYCITQTTATEKWFGACLFFYTCECGGAPFIDVSPPPPPPPPWFVLPPRLLSPRRHRCVYNVADPGRLVFPCAARSLARPPRSVPLFPLARIALRPAVPLGSRPFFIPFRVCFFHLGVACSVRPYTAAMTSAASEGTRSPVRL